MSTTTGTGSGPSAESCRSSSVRRTRRWTPRCAGSPAPGRSRRTRGSRGSRGSHLYDPHEPYDPPEPFRSRYASRSVLRRDRVLPTHKLGEALDDLTRRQLLTNTLVVVAADHGESLGEHQERTHGLFAYDATLRVPLIVWAPPAVKPGVLRGPSRLVDVMPTVLDLVNVPATPPSGRSLLPFARAGEPVDDAGVYFEALNASLTRHWAPLTGLVSGGFKLIDLPIPELYDLAADPAERVNLFEQRKDVAASLQRGLSGLRANAAACRAGRRRPRNAAPSAGARLCRRRTADACGGAHASARGRSEDARCRCTTGWTMRSRR